MPRPVSIVVAFVVALTVLLLAVESSSAQTFESRVVQSLSQQQLKEARAHDSIVLLVTFYRSGEPLSKQFAPKYTSLIKTQLKGGEYLMPAAVDCAKEATLCEDDLRINTEVLPVMKLINGKKVFTHKAFGKELVGKSAKDLAEWVHSAYPNHVTQLTGKSEKEHPRENTKARVLLFTDKKTTPPLYKALAMSFRKQPDQVSFVEVRKQEKKLLDHYSVGTKTFPVIMIEPATPEGEEERSPRRYEGKMEKAPLLKWIGSFLPSAATGAPSADSAASGAAAIPEVDTAAAAATAVSAVPKLTDQSCLEKYCSGPLCLVMFLSAEHPDLQKHLTTFGAIEEVAKQTKSIGRVNFVYADSIVAPHATEWMTANFDLQPQDYPQVALLSMRKERYAPYVGAFSQGGILEFLKGVTKGAVRTIPFATSDKKLRPLPVGDSCPPDAKKPFEPEAPRKPKTNGDKGELVHLTTKIHEGEVLRSNRPWVLLFHSSAAPSTNAANLTSEFERVAVNMKDTVMFGAIDVAQEPTLAQHWGIDALQVPVIYSLPHTAAGKTPQQLSKYEADLTSGTVTAKDIRAFAQERLAPAKVLVVSQATMNEFMGGMEPGQPFAPKFIIFLKPTDDDGKETVVIPDMIRALALEYPMTFGVASSKSRDLARQFQVTKIPSAYVMAQQADPPGEAPSMQMRVGATPFVGELTYRELRTFCETALNTYQQQKLQWAAAAKSAPKTKSTKAKKKATAAAEEEEERVNLDDQPHDEL